MVARVGIFGAMLLSCITCASALPRRVSAQTSPVSPQQQQVEDKPTKKENGPFLVSQPECLYSVRPEDDVKRSRILYVKCRKALCKNISPASPATRHCEGDLKLIRSSKNAMRALLGPLRAASTFRTFRCRQAS